MAERFIGKGLLQLRIGDLNVALAHVVVEENQ